jgi:uroporphyrinogen-III synthase
VTPPADVSRRLAGRAVLVPRDPARAAALAELLRAEGAEVLVAPVTATAPPPDPDALDAAVRDLVGGRHAWVAVTSVNAVAALRGAAARTGVVLGDVPSRWAAVGPATAQALERAGVRVSLTAAGTAAALAEAFPLPPEVSEARDAPASPASDTTPATTHVSEARDAPASPASDRTPRDSVLLPLGDLARRTLADGLEARGWVVRTAVAYRTVPVELPGDVVARARTGGLDAVVVAAGSAAREIARQLGDGTPVVAIGRPSADAAAAAGLRVAAVAADPTDSALADAVAHAFTTTEEMK